MNVRITRGCLILLLVYLLLAGSRPPSVAAQAPADHPGGAGTLWTA